ncbi:LOW QUALITY PROTEIN: putative transmembrane protein [Psychrobacter sp. JCM 18901]|nr:LOW QUALITY PROTEIN: putative transmembrane protein [Psychrobacter sp. JCM 18901]
MALSTDYSTSASRSHSSQLDPKNIDLTYLDPDARAVLDFWFDKNNEAYWFEQNDRLISRYKIKFGDIWHAAKQGECVTWRIAESSLDGNSSITALAGRLAEIIVLDQFSRNLCRGQASAFAQDGMALALAQEAIQQPYFDTLPMQWRRFIIIPFMHSESAMIHKRYLPLFEQLDDANTLDFEHRHKQIIDQFGRYPHRNEVLNRDSTEDEKNFLKQPNSSF